MDERSVDGWVDEMECYSDGTMVAYSGNSSGVMLAGVKDHLMVAYLDSFADAVMVVAMAFRSGT